MAHQTKGGFCASCGVHRAVSRKSPNHILHLILALITGGLWLIVWIILCLTQFGGWRCNTCGGTEISKVD